MMESAHFGDGTIAQIAPILEQIAARSIFLVTGKRSFARSGAQAALKDVLSGQRVTRFSDFAVNPKLPDVERGLALFRENECDAILAVGGGSVIDVGKLVGIASTQSATLMDIATGRCPIEMDSPPIAAVPTTAGSGSEATHFAVVYVGGNKFSVAHESMLPGFVVVDPQLTQSLPASITAVTGLDALCQAVESMWCIHSTEESISYSREAVTLVLNHLERAVREPTPCDRTAMCRASHLAGRAINLTKTTAPHAISYTLTARYGIPHGHAVALTLGPMLSYNSAVNDNDVADPRGAQHVRQVIHALNGLLCCADADESCNRIQRLIQSVHLPTRLRDVGATSDVDRQFLVDQVNMQRLANNPRRVTPEALADLLARIA